MHIRKARSDDEDTVFALAREFAVSFEVERSAFQTSFQHLMTDDKALLLVAEEHNQIIGYCLGFEHHTFFANGRVAWVEEIMVNASMRKQGVGRLLMSEFETWARDRQVALVALATRRAAGFYKALGYEESATYFRKHLKQ